jgi:hypothetical protein
MTQISFNSNTFLRDNLEKLVDTRFKQLLKPTTGEDTSFTVDDFFILYDDLFYQINPEGDVQSHRFILNRTAEYLGVKINEESNVQALLDEITLLKQELLDANKSLGSINKI